MPRIWRNLKENKALINSAAKAAKNDCFILLDTETTGLRSDDEIVQFSAVKCGYDEKFYTKDVIDVYIKPHKWMLQEAVDVNHITNEFLADKPTAPEIFPQIKAFMGECPALGAYNLPFDLRMIKSLYSQCGEQFTPSLEFDLLKVAKDILCEQKMKDHKLETVCNYYGVDDEVQGYHSAIEDTKVLVKLLNAMIDDIKVNGIDRNDAPKRNLRLYKLNYWPGFRGNSRLYAITSGGSVYYDMKNDAWVSNTQELDINTVNMPDLEAQVFGLAASQDGWNASTSNDYKELARLCRQGAFSN